MKVRHIGSEYTTVIRDAHLTTLQNLTDMMGSTGENLIITIFLIWSTSLQLSTNTYKFIPINFSVFISAIVIITPNIGFQGIAGNFGAWSLIW
jgi:hypothetical protein